MECPADGREEQGGDCDNGADKAKQQEVSTHTNTNTNTDIDRNTNTIWAGDVHTSHLRYNNDDISVTIISSAA